MSYEFPITISVPPPTSVRKSLDVATEGDIVFRAENLPVEGCRPIELYVGDGRPYDEHALLTVEEFRALVNSLDELCQHWEAGGA